MAEAGFPGQHTTTTTVTSSTTVQTNIRFDPSYIKTVPGILKIVQAGASLLGFICVQVASYRSSRSSFFAWISMMAFWFTGLLLGLYLFHLVEKFYKIPWLKIELVFCGLWTFFYLIASSLVVAWSVISAFAAAAFFGYAAMLAYLIDAYLKYRAVQDGGLAQGTRVVSRQTAATVTTPPRVGY
ncbi:hypothetical protein MSG28_001916 [Choristoneura fumiferana]|uniref:Uncharacterized protein n=1 Tax=Choristoneura fumiferana TaxID=7141 RepID=A0ACC0JTL4_CHOFU|nr:hypothetical protein MSG28_001916 [Choristoneura fumiferana]